MGTYLCPDGRSIAGVTNHCILQNGVCDWEITHCPAPAPGPAPGPAPTPDCSAPNACGLRPLALILCPDGSTAGVTNNCILQNGECHWEVTHCRDTPAPALIDAGLADTTVTQKVCNQFCMRGNACNPMTGRCEPVSCDAPNACPNQICQPFPRGCSGLGSFCPQFTCVAPHICTKLCIQNTQCNPATGTCDAINCNGPNACPAFLQCVPVSKICASGGFCPQFECDPLPTCPTGQEYQQCGTACPLTCDNPTPGICSDHCVAGCFCQAGLVLTSDGQCVSPDQCPATCPTGQEYQQCGTACPLTCDNPTPGICSDHCVAGCFCQAGLVLTSDGQCVSPDQCPGPCPLGQEYQQCGTACPLTCANPNPGICDDLCVAGCFCSAGLLLTSDGQCVTPDQCPAV
jgi:hypothetical protein